MQKCKKGQPYFHFGKETWIGLRWRFARRRRAVAGRLSAHADDGIFVKQTSALFAAEVSDDLFRATELSPAEPSPSGDTKAVILTGNANEPRVAKESNSEMAGSLRICVARLVVLNRREKSSRKYHNIFLTWKSI